MTAVQVATETYASLITNYSSTASMTYKELILPFGSEITSGLGRILYLKEAAEDQGTPVISAVTVSQMFVQNSTILYLNSNESVTLQYFSTNNYGILGGYPGASTFTTNSLQSNVPIGGGPQNIFPNMNTSLWLVDLRTNSKYILLPAIASIDSNLSQAPFYTIKDVYGCAATNNLWISSDCNANVIENANISNICINKNYASIDLVANRFLNKWHIVNYYDGTLVANPP